MITVIIKKQNLWKYGWEYTGWEFPRGNLPWRNLIDGNFPIGSFPGGVFLIPKVIWPHNNLTVNKIFNHRKLHVILQIGSAVLRSGNFYGTKKIVTVQFRDLWCISYWYIWIIESSNQQEFWQKLSLVSFNSKADQYYSSLDMFSKRYQKFLQII